MLSQATIDIVKSTAPVMQIHGEAITRHMYAQMLTDPIIRSMFDPTHQRNGSQAKALAGAVAAYAANIDNLAALGPAVERIAERHAALSVQPYHYDIVGTHLLASVTAVLGGAATPAIMEAWTEAYGALRDIFVQVESAKYRDRGGAPGGWYGYRRFRVDRVAEESSVIRSLYLVPEDGKPILGFLPGQYLTLRLPVEGHGPLLRHYSLSSRPGQSHYRISVKREDVPGPGIPAGLGSQHLHGAVAEGDIVEVAPPAGAFILSDDDRPLVLLSGGVGITPMLSMLEHVSTHSPNRLVQFFHAAQNRQRQPFAAQIRALAAAPAITATLLLEDADGAVAGVDHDQVGRIDPARVVAAAPADAIYYVCGPTGFMRAIIAGLRAHGIAPASIRYEYFGSAEAELNP